MITLITGRPGSGKSLLAVEMILENATAERIRPLFCNIDGLDFDKLRCFPLDDPTTWPDLPAGSLVVIDEAQRVMPPRASGAKAPAHVDFLNEHRHAGLDVILITPDPKLIDVMARKTVGRHLHAYRPFGLEHRKIFEWNSCNEDPEPSQGEKNALVTKKPFDKNLYEFYTSAEVHTHKSRPPLKKISLLIGSALTAVCLFAWSFWSLWQHGPGDSASVEPLPEPAAIIQAGQGMDPGVVSGAVPVIYAPPAAFFRSRVVVDGRPEYRLELGEGGGYAGLDSFPAYRIEGVRVLLLAHAADTEPQWVVTDSDLVEFLRSDAENFIVSR
ncbi:zonular occludens toxin domain-containing protein [Aeromonas caviae]|uniref:zonular occludens toxin domain-containing protein n=1 Tax=Aeromonas caviae TaxID=648 RepID=UPI002B4AA2EA|nr:zonular occludens toxin domain-containing protein [Aeromonas caviae]